MQHILRECDDDDTEAQVRRAQIEVIDAYDKAWYNWVLDPDRNMPYWSARDIDITAVRAFATPIRCIKDQHRQTILQIGTNMHQTEQPSLEENLALAHWLVSFLVENVMVLLIHCDLDAMRGAYHKSPQPEALSALFNLHHGLESTVWLFGMRRSSDAECFYLWCPQQVTFAGTQCLAKRSIHQQHFQSLVWSTSLQVGKIRAHDMQSRDRWGSFLNYVILLDPP